MRRTRRSIRLRRQRTHARVPAGALERDASACAQPHARAP